MLKTDAGSIPVEDALRPGLAGETITQERAGKGNKCVIAAINEMRKFTDAVKFLRIGQIKELAQAYKVKRKVFAKKLKALAVADDMKQYLRKGGKRAQWEEAMKATNNFVHPLWETTRNGLVAAQVAIQAQSTELQDKRPAVILGESVRMITKAFDQVCSVSIDHIPKNVITFSGGEGEYTFESSTAHEKTKGLASETAVEAEGTLQVEKEINIFWLGLEWDTQTGAKYNLEATTSRERASGQSTSVAFTLSDDDVGDQFDVAVYKDPIYGTPIFKTLSGRSSCPHEANTAPRDRYDVKFYGGFKTKTVNIAADEDSVSIMVVITTFSATGDNDAMIVRLYKPEVAVEDSGQPPLGVFFNTWDVRVVSTRSSSPPRSC